MIIKAVKLYEKGFFTQDFVFGGEEGPDKFDASIRYRSSLQNYVIDTGEEVILVDTGLPKETPEFVADETTKVYIGSVVQDYVSALKEVGYAPEQVSKILITHKHEDHTGELRAFPDAKIYVSPEEADALKLTGNNVVRVDYKDGPYYNFDRSEKIAEGVYYLPAKGHTLGNSVVVVEADGLFYMIHGDVTYTDEALYANKLSIANEDQQLARETFDKVREFMRNHPTVYLSTHTPCGYENLEAKRIVDLDNPPELKAIDYEIPLKQGTGKYICNVCGHVYDPAENGGVAFEDLPDDWKCPRCKQGKDKFNKA
ncbi:MAG: MBL fold metallo-hydrolase [Thermoguttaceae bacterium]|nr:MBL fold metallo-hydrolase [Thermoguttaceae bacterium]